MFKKIKNRILEKISGYLKFEGILGLVCFIFIFPMFKPILHKFWLNYLLNKIEHLLSDVYLNNLLFIKLVFIWFIVLDF
jgi:hypothetical protein